jgi:restriction system protein
VPERIAVQVKRLQANVRRPEIQALRGSLATHERGLFITTGGFSRGAAEEAMRATATPIGLMTGEELAGQLIELRVGVREENGVLALQDDLLEDSAADNT